MTLREWAGSVAGSYEEAEWLTRAILRQSYRDTDEDTMHTEFEWWQIAYLSGLTMEGNDNE